MTVDLGDQITTAGYAPTTEDISFQIRDVLSEALKYLQRARSVRESSLNRYLLFNDHGIPFKPHEISIAILLLEHHPDVETVIDGDRTFHYRSQLPRDFSLKEDSQDPTEYLEFLEFLQLAAL